MTTQRSAAAGLTRTGGDRPWWRDAVVYQIYPRSFADSGGDGVGDLEGIRQRLGHLVDLGVDGLWLSPCYPSPQADHGYDVSDYTDIHPEYGDLDRFDRLLAEAHGLGLRLLMDIVPNHCSTDHAWFVAAVAAGPGSHERSRFLFRDGLGVDGGLPPNSWRSVFGGSAWTRVTEADGRPGQWYLHLFDERQADFDWRCPDVGDLFEDVLRFWFDRGVDGFRIDVAHGLVKEEGLPEWALPGHVRTSPDGTQPPMWNQPEVHDVYRRWRRIADSYAGRDLTLVGEVWVSDPADLLLYLRQDELPQAFHFDLLVQPWRAPDLRRSVDRGLDEIGRTGATVTWTLANHDVHRAVTRYGRDQDRVVVSVDDPAGGTRVRGPVDLAQGTRFARAAALVTLALPGSVYVYQGEELGLPEVLDLPDSVRQDPIFRRTGGAELGRDGSRVPLPWEHDAASFGFSRTADAAEPAAPWLPQPDWFAGYAVDVEESDPHSMYSLYRRALALRPGLFSDDDRPVDWLRTDGTDGTGGAGREDVLAFARGDSVCVAVTGEQPYDLPAAWGEVVLASDAVDGRRLPAGAGAWLSR